jgi:hypothetical protein
MGAPSKSPDTRDSGHLALVDRPDATTADDDGALAAIGFILSALDRKDKKAEESASLLLEVRQGFLDQFHATCTSVVRPAMEAVVTQLRQDGGDGLIEEHPGGEPRVSTPRLTIWMSLQGPIVGTPRPDRHPYLQLDADMDHRIIRLTEGDFWHDSGAGHSGSAGTWKPRDVTRALVLQELLAIVGRSAQVPPS